MICKWYPIFLALGIWGGITTAVAQSTPTSISDWYLHNLFSISDANGDQLLSMSELKEMGKSLAYYVEPKNFRKADKNGDGVLNEFELKFRMGQAMVFRLESDEKELKTLEQKYPYFSEAKLKYLKRHPDLTSRLMDNLVWTRTHPDLVNKLISDRSWLSQHPEVAFGLSKNFAWLTEQAATARKFYRLREAKSQGGVLRLWRDSHKETLITKPEWERQVHSLDFPYWPGKQQLADSQSQYETSSETSWNPQKAAIDSLAKKQERLKVAYEKKIANLQYQLRKRDSIARQITDAPLEKTYAGNDLKSLKAANQALQDRLRAFKIEQKLSRIEEDSLLLTTIRQRKKIVLLEQKITPTQAGGQKKSDITLTDLQPVPLPASSGVQKKEQISRYESRIKALEREKNSLTALIDQLRAENKAKDKNNTELEGQLASLTQKGSALQHTADSLKNIIRSSQIQLVSTDSVRQENLLLKQQIELLLGENQKLAIAYDERVIGSDALQDSLDQMLAAWKVELQRNQSLSQTNQSKLAGIQDELEDVKAKNRMLSTLMAKQKDSLINQIQLQQTEINRLNEVANTTHTPAPQASIQDGGAQTDVVDRWKEQQLAFTMRIDELEYDNAKLREEREASLKLALDKEEILEKRLKSSLAENRELRFKNQRLKKRRKAIDSKEWARLDELAFEMEKARGKITQLEDVNEALLNQLEANNAYISEHIQEKNYLRSALGNEKAIVAKERSVNDTLRTTIKRQKASAVWEDSVMAYKERLFAMKQRFIVQQTLNQQEIGHMEAQMDSLESEMNGLRKLNAQIRSTNKVDMERIVRSDDKQKELQSLYYKLDEKTNMLQQREKMIEEKIAELEQKEKKYQQLRAWEKELYLLERRIKNDPNYERQMKKRR